jgi:hypothetical protein
LLIGFKTLGYSSGITTLFAQSLGILLSMFFAMDLWWKLITKEISEKIKLRKRFEFISIAGISGLTSAIATGLLLREDDYKTTHLLIINWVCLGSIAVVKYLFFSKRILRSK